MSEELQELQEHADEAKHNPTLVPVSVTMAALAVLVAVASLLGHRSHTEELVLQTKSADQWAFYQAKNIRRHLDEIFVDLTAGQANTSANDLAKSREKYSQEAARYEKEQKEIEDQAKDLEAEVASERNRADRYDLAEVFLEIALVITSITLLSGRRLFWGMGLVLGGIGIVLAVTGYFTH
jgi:hypothetical protein